MPESDPTRLYGLALTMIADPDVAGDLMMAARSEEDLLRRANRWRERQGLPYLFRLPAPRELTPDQAEHAHHLARRSRRRIRLYRGALGGSALAALALCFFGLTSLLAALRPPAGPGLAAHPFFAEPALEMAVHPAGYRVEIHRVEARPGSVALWWSASGPGAREAAATLNPRLQLGERTGEWHTPAATETDRTHSGRVLGRTLFEALVTSEQQAQIALGPQRSDRAAWVLQVELTRIWTDPAAVTIPLNQSIERGPVSIYLHSLVRGTNYTRLIYSSTSTIGRSPILNGIRADDRLLLRKGPLTAAATLPDEAEALVEALFEPLPVGVGSLSLSFANIYLTLPPRTFVVPSHPAIEHFSQQGDQATAVVALDDEAWGGLAQGYFTAASGTRYEADISYQVEGSPPRHRIMVRSRWPLPPGEELLSFTVTGLRYHLVLSDLPVQLPATK